MTREQILNVLTESGIECPKAVITALMTAFNDDKRQAVEEAKAQALTEAKEQFKDYKTPQEFATLSDELTSLKESNARTERLAKVKAKGVSDKLLEFVDSKVKGEEDYDKALDKYLKENPEFLHQAPSGGTITFSANTGSNVEEGSNKEINNFLRRQ